LVAKPLPTGKQLAAAAAPEKSYDPFLVVPPPPNEVQTLLNQYSQASIRLNVPEDRFNLMEFLRNALYDKVTAAGAGSPVSITAVRVGQMLDGADATPYEITAAEAMLARWAGVPSRIGYGYYGGEKQQDGSYQVRPKDGATF